MDCCCNPSGQRDREERVTALRRTIDEARRKLIELEEQEEAA